MIGTRAIGFPLTLLLAVSASLPAQAPPEQQAAAQAPAQPAAAEKHSYYAEVGAFYHTLNNDYGTWRGLDARLGYTGNSRVVPYFTFSTQTRDEGAQQSYGAYSYLKFSQSLWSIVGISAAPEKETLLYPKTRFDATLFVGVPRTPGLFASVGYTDFAWANQAGGRIASVGGLYYFGKYVMNGSFQFNSLRPGANRSFSGQAGIQYGSQGDFWIGAGIAGGKLAYPVMSLVPFDVRFTSVGFNCFYQQWLSRHFGLIVRYDFQNQMDAFQRHGLYIAPFFEF